MCGGGGGKEKVEGAEVRAGQVHPLPLPPYPSTACTPPPAYLSLISSPM